MALKRYLIFEGYEQSIITLGDQIQFWVYHSRYHRNKFIATPSMGRDLYQNVESNMKYVDDTQTYTKIGQTFKWVSGKYFKAS